MAASVTAQSAAASSSQAAVAYRASAQASSAARVASCPYSYNASAVSRCTSVPIGCDTGNSHRALGDPGVAVDGGTRAYFCVDRRVPDTHPCTRGGYRARPGRTPRRPRPTVTARAERSPQPSSVDLLQEHVGVAQLAGLAPAGQVIPSQLTARDRKSVV